jgi:hypothetical protein
MLLQLFCISKELLYFVDDPEPIVASGNSSTANAETAVRPTRKFD